MAAAGNDPFRKPFGGAKSDKGGKNKKISTGYLATPVAFSRSDRSLNRTMSKQDKQMGSRGMR